MSQYSLREVKSTFEEILGENSSVLQELDKTIRSTQSDIDTVKSLYDRALDKFVTAQIRPINSEMLKNLSGLAGRATSFEDAYKNDIAKSREAEIRLNSLQATHGDEASLYGKLKKLTEENNALSDQVSGLWKESDKLKDKLRPVDDFNAFAASKNKPLLDAEGLDYFSSKKGFGHVWSWLTDKHYRQGQSIAKSFAAEGADIPAMQKKLVDNASTEKQLAEKIEAVSNGEGIVQAQIKEMRSTADLVVSEHALREKLKRNVIVAFEDEKFLNKTAKSLGAKFPVFIVEQRAKLENLKKIQGAAQKSRQTVQQAGDKLDKHMPKLRKGASRSGSTRISIDLNGIKTSFTGMQKGVRTQATQLRQTSASVRDYQSGGTAASSAPAQGGMDPVMFMAIMMMSDIQSPTIDTSSVGDNFNANALDAANIDAAVPDISVMVPDISVSVPDISVPDISYDSGGYSGGSDFGGGGGGFD